jgi:hypothetical protein
VERSRSGRGQVVDAAMVDGAALLSAMIHGMRAMGSWTDERGANLLDTGAPFYEVYETKDGKCISIGSIEPRFYLQLLERTGLAGESLPNRMDRDQWPALKQRLRTVFKTKSRDEWCAIMEGSDVCFAPVLTLGEAPQAPALETARDLHRCSWRHSTGPGATPESDASGGEPPGGPTRAEHRGHAGELGSLPGADYGAAREQGGRLTQPNRYAAQPRSKQETGRKIMMAPAFATGLRPDSRHRRRIAVRFSLWLFPQNNQIGQRRAPSRIRPTQRHPRALLPAEHQRFNRSRDRCHGARSRTALLR